MGFLFMYLGILVGLQTSQLVEMSHPHMFQFATTKVNAD
jgi:hypothetical protein